MSDTSTESAKTLPVVADGSRVGFWEKTALGSGFLAVFFGTAGVKGFAIPVYQMTMGVNPALLGLVLALPSFWDAITDPIAGYVSDNLKTRWGRRRPMIVLGAILQAIAFGAIWMVPSSFSETQSVVYLAVTLIVFYTCFTIFSVPLMSLTYEMTPDYNERTRVASFGAFFSKIGEFLYQGMFPIAGMLVVWGLVSEGNSVLVIGWIVGILILGTVGVLPGLFVKERYFKKATLQKKVRLWPSVKATWGNKAFLVLVGLTLCQVLAGMVASSTDYYLLVYYMCDGDIVVGSNWKWVLSVGYAAVGLAWIYPINWLSSRYGKSATMAVIFALVLVGAIVKWYVYTPGNMWKILIDPIFCGPVWMALGILTPSMFADICDDDELRHGFRREGMFGAVFSFLQKFGFSLAFFGTGLALNWAGFNEELGGNQSEGTIHSLRLFLSISTAIWALFAIVLLFAYPISKKRAYEIRAELEARRGAI